MARRSMVRSQIPDEILNNDFLNEAAKTLPSNYNFEIHKTVWKIKSLSSKNVALQFPEGLLMYACVIADILEQFAGCDVIILADVTYGACCVDDFTARALNCDLMVHYGHSCLVPIQETKGIQMLYIFVDIKIDTSHLIDTIEANFSPENNVALVSTIQFAGSLQTLARELKSRNFDHVTVPQAKPLSPGEILGCTAPRLDSSVITSRPSTMTSSNGATSSPKKSPSPDTLIYVGDGRFHLESVMIANPEMKAYRYDPYSKEITREYYDYGKMMRTRAECVERAKNARNFGLILGALGRQGNPKIFSWLEEKLTAAGKNVTLVVLSEIFPAKLQIIGEQNEKIDCWIQVACPRLSIDWGAHFDTPILTPYEAAVFLRQIEWQSRYPMDFYANDSLGPWTNKNVAHRPDPKAAPRRHLNVQMTS